MPWPYTLCDTTNSDENNPNRSSHQCSQTATGDTLGSSASLVLKWKRHAAETKTYQGTPPHFFFGDIHIFRFAQKLIKIISKSTFSDTEHTCYLWAVFSTHLCHSTADHKEHQAVNSRKPGFSGQSENLAQPCSSKYSLAEAFFRGLGALFFMHKFIIHIFTVKAF